jgi:hypothetical protein
MRIHQDLIQSFRLNAEQNLVLSVEEFNAYWRGRKTTAEELRQATAEVLAAMELLRVVELLEQRADKLAQ